MTKDKKKKADKPAPVTTSMPARVFIYNELNTHAEQRELWNEPMQGKVYELLDHELRIDEDKGYYVVKKIGETVAGKVYELDDDQLKNTDWWMGENHERKQVYEDGKAIHVYKLIRGNK